MRPIRRAPLATLVPLALIMTACPTAPAQSDATTPPTQAPSPSLDAPDGARWLLSQPPGDARDVAIARHLRGFDVAMLEVGHRHVELYWAGQDQNWAYADYQLDKLAVALIHGLERRPARATSAQLLEEPLADTRAAIKAQDAAAFTSAFDALTLSCNACHQAEQVGFMRVGRPSARLTAIGATPISAAP